MDIKLNIKRPPLENSLKHSASRHILVEKISSEASRQSNWAAGLSPFSSSGIVVSSHLIGQQGKSVVVRAEARALYFSHPTFHGTSYAQFW